MRCEQLALPGMEYFLLSAKEVARLPRVEVAPGVLGPLIPRKFVPRYVFAKLPRLADGTYALVPQEITTPLRVPVVAAALDCNKKVIYRLYDAGFLRGYNITGHCLRIDPQSVVEHLQRCEDREFWTPARKRLYAEARLVMG